MKFKRQVIRESNYWLGKDAPYYYFLGQIEQESRCNENITSFDGGMGLAQFMPSTSEWIHEREKSLQELSLKPLPYSPLWSIRAMILYDRYLYERVLCSGWYFVFRAYNGGLGLLNREIKKANSCDWDIVEKNCNRKKIYYKNSYIDLCKVNCSYPYSVFLKSYKYM